MSPNQVNSSLTLGSLFDGSGGFPLGGLLAGVTPVWASEIEPFPIRVTTRRFPNMKHYGDISQMDGGKIEPVDIITFGSPCTDMSIAGKRAGLDGAQSSLFYQAIRIIKEMRCATNGRFPRWACWENVIGAFSSNRGKDFKAVLDAVIGIVEPGAEVPMPEKNQWPYADVYMGGGWSVAYRTFDAQYWGVPQRRRRCYLVADLGGCCAGKVLFESEGLSGYSAESVRAWQRTAGAAADCSGTADRICLNSPCIQKAAGFCAEHSASSGGIGYAEEISPTLRASVVPAVMTLYGNHPQYARCTGPLATAPTISRTYGTGGNNQPLIVQEHLPVRWLTPTECAKLQGFPPWWCSELETAEPTETDIAFWTEVWETYRRTASSSTRPKSRAQVIKWLQHPHSDSAAYRMWGNGVALPCVFFVLAGIVLVSDAINAPNSALDCCVYYGEKQLAISPF